MRTSIHSSLSTKPASAAADSILRKCVHCGMCNATCPTYLELGDERDGPRGRIYLIKQLLEEGQASAKTRTHLDRCLTCLNCETTCPSGVQYGQLLDIGRGLIEEQQKRTFWDVTKRKLLRWLLPYPNRLKPLLRIGQTVRALLPSRIRSRVPYRQIPGLWPDASTFDRQMLVLEGCVQAAATPQVNTAAARVLGRLGIGLQRAPSAGCCGAVDYHLGEHEAGLEFARRNIDAWWPAIEEGIEAIVITASGCGVLVKDYGDLLRDDSSYAQKAEHVSSLARDLSEVLMAEDLSALGHIGSPQSKVAVHCPCTLQHGQRMPDILGKLMAKLGIATTQTKDSHLCCGSAGTYSLLQPEMSRKLLRNKLAALTGDDPSRILSANIGCQLHLQTESSLPVQHWIEYLDEQLDSG